MLKRFLPIQDHAQDLERHADDQHRHAQRQNQPDRLQHTGCTIKTDFINPVNKDQFVVNKPGESATQYGTYIINANKIISIDMNKAQFDEFKTKNIKCLTLKSDEVNNFPETLEENQKITIYGVLEYPQFDESDKCSGVSLIVLHSKVTTK